MMSLFPVTQIRAIIGTGRVRLSTTWLMTRLSVTVPPRPTTTKAGAMVIVRRTQRGMRNLIKSCMIA